MQAFAAGMMWGWAAVVASGHRVWLFWVSMLWALSPWWVSWERRVLTEALMLAGLALFAAGVGRMLATPAKKHWVSVALGAGVALLARPLSIVLVLPILLVLLSAPQVRRLMARGVAVFLALLCTWSAVQAVVFNTAEAHYHYLPSTQSMMRIQAQDRLAFRHRVPGYLDLAREAGMPSCPAVEKSFKRPPGGPLKTLWDTDSTCPEFAAWLDRGGLPWWRELVANPYWTVRYVVDPDWVLADSGGFAVDPRFSSLPERAVSGVMWLTILAAALALLRRGPDWGRRALLVGACAGFCGVMIMTDGMEFWRHLSPGLVVLGWVAFAWWGARRDPVTHDLRRAR